MKSPVIIKGNKYGFQIVLNPDISFENLLEEVGKKFGESRGFFDQDRSVAVNFSGRDLTDEEQDLLVDKIVDSSGLRVCYIIDGAKNRETEFAKMMQEFPQQDQSRVDNAEAGPQQFFGEPSFHTSSQEPEDIFSSEQKTEKNGQFYRGTLRSGQSIEVDGSIVILGDINPGAQVHAGGNVVVLGCLKGTVTAGYPDDQSAVVAALLMDPIQIRIGDIIARSSDQKASIKLKKKFRKKQPELEPKLAFVENNNIFIEPITRSLISEFSTI